ncbi:MAG TPA: hypothetical protein PK437_01285 [Thiobacillaceae bacterium]|nr:hypothetical protein [Thiobacillaceae bacterium]HNJ38656.1 hypothetical protein [Nitrosomonas sp.]
MKTWSSEAAPDEICAVCGALYEVRIYRLPVKDQDSFYCEQCRNLLKSWSSTRVPEYKLKKQGDADPL